MGVVATYNLQEKTTQSDLQDRVKPKLVKRISLSIVWYVEEDHTYMITHTCQSKL